MTRNYLIVIIMLFVGTMQAQTVEWATSIGSNYTDRVMAAIIDNQGNKYIGGHFNDTVDFDLGAGTAIMSNQPFAYGAGNAFILKLDANDNFIKVITIGKQTSPSYIGVTSMQKDASGNLYVLGFFNATVDFDPDTTVIYDVTPSGNSYFLLKLDANDNFVWVKNWGNNFNAGVANGSSEIGPAMFLDAASNAYITGRYMQTIDFDPSGNNYNLTSYGNSGYVLKLNSNGDFVWVKEIANDTSITGSFAYPRSISGDATGNIYVSGEFFGKVDFNPDTTTTLILIDTVQKGFVLKLNSNGDYQWVNKIGSVGNPNIYSYNYANAVAVDAAANIIVVGSFMGTISLGSSTLVSNGYSDIFIAKMDASGNYLWGKNIGNTWDDDRATHITIDAANNLYISGTYAGTLDFNPGSGLKTITSNGSADAYLLKLNNNGDFEWAKGFGGSGNSEHIYNVAVKGNNVLTVGKFMGQMNCDNDGSYYISATHPVTSSNYYDGWIVKINQGTTRISYVNDEVDFSIYPNPASHQFTIDVSKLKQSHLQATLMDLQGRVIRNITLNTTTTKVDVINTPKGIYMIKIHGDYGSIVKKIVVE